MARSDATVILGRAFLLFCGVIVVAALYFARDVLLPLALAILLSFLLSPVVARLEKWRLGRIPSVVIVAVVAFGLVATLGYVLLLQAYEVANQLPEYKDNIVAKIESFRGGESVRCAGADGHSNCLIRSLELSNQRSVSCRKGRTAGVGVSTATN